MCRDKLKKLFGLNNPILTDSECSVAYLYVKKYLIYVDIADRKHFNVFLLSSAIRDQQCETVSLLLKTEAYLSNPYFWAVSALKSRNTNALLLLLTDGAPINMDKLSYLAVKLVDTTMLKIIMNHKTSDTFKHRKALNLAVEIENE